MHDRQHDPFARVLDDDPMTAEEIAALDAEDAELEQQDEPSEQDARNEKLHAEVLKKFREIRSE